MDSIQRAAKAQEVLDGLDWLKSEALKKLNEEIPGLDIQNTRIVNVGYEPPNENFLIEDGDVVLWTVVNISMQRVSLDQLSDLLNISSDVVIDGVNITDTPATYDIEYKVSYDFTLWDDKLEDNFTRLKER